MEIDQLTLSFAGEPLQRAAFNRALENAAENQFIPKPLMLGRLSKERWRTIQTLQRSRQVTREEIIRRAKIYEEEARDLPLIYQFAPACAGSKFDPLDLSLQSMWVQRQLETQGAVFGNQAFNFVLGTASIWESQAAELEQIAIKSLETIKCCRPQALSLKNLTPTEKAFEELKLSPNAARVDILETSCGQQMKVIEVNTQWVDAIQALEAFQVAFLGKAPTPSPSSLLADAFRGKKKLALINLASASGSRQTGALKELGILARNLVSKGLFSEVEVVNPRIIRPEYLKRFSGFYINGEPGMVGSNVPDWIEVILERLVTKQASMFPNWRPSLDKKAVLVEAAQRSTDFLMTLPYSSANLDQFRRKGRQVVIKGDSYSSRNVAIEGTKAFEGLEKEAELSPGEFIIQPYVAQDRIYQKCAFDTSSGKPVILREVKSKTNIWVINGRVAGNIVSYSQNAMISDKDYNGIYKPTKDKDTCR